MKKEKILRNRNKKEKLEIKRRNSKKYLTPVPDYLKLETEEKDNIQVAVRK